MAGFPSTVIDRLIRKASKASVSRSAILELNAILETYAIEITKTAIKLAQYRGAKTINEKDIRTAVAKISS